MLVTPRSGVNLDNLIQTLQSVRTDASNRVSGASTAHKRLLAFLEWANQAARTLRYQISECDVAALVTNRRYELLLSSFGTMASPEQGVQRVVNDLVTLELEQRTADLDETVKTLQAYQRRWSGVGDLVVLDTNFYLHHPDKLEDADISAVTGAHTSGSMMHVLVPIVVVDELDNLKQSKDKDVRWRSRYTVAVLDRVFKGGPLGRLYPEDNTVTPEGLVGRGEVTMELLFDPPGHVRLPINDDEIVDRAVSVQVLAGRDVTLVTYDTGMSTRARNAGLKVGKLSEDIGEEPTEDEAGRRRGGS